MCKATGFALGEDQVWTDWILLGALFLLAASPSLSASLLQPPRGGHPQLIIYVDPCTRTGMFSLSHPDVVLGVHGASG